MVEGLVTGRLPRYELQPDGRVAYLTARLPVLPQGHRWLRDEELEAKLFKPYRNVLPDGLLALAYDVLDEVGPVRLRHGDAASVERWAADYGRKGGTFAAAALRVIYLVASSEGIETLNNTIHSQAALERLHAALSRPDEAPDH